MKKIIILLLLIVVSFVAGFAFFFPADVLTGNFLLSKGVKFENIKGNLLSLSIFDINVYGIKTDTLRILNRGIVTDLKLTGGEVKLFPFGKNLNLNVENEEFFIDRDDIKGIGLFSGKGKFNLENLKGEIKGKIVLKELSYNGIRTKDVNVEIDCKDGKVSGKVNHSLIKGIISGILKRKDGKLLFNGNFKGTAFGSRINERLSFETAI